MTQFKIAEVHILPIFKRSNKEAAIASRFEISLKMNVKGRKLEYFSKDKVSERIREKGVSETNFNLPGIQHKRPGEGSNELDVITALNEDLQKNDLIEHALPCEVGKFLLLRALVVTGSIWSDAKEASYDELKDVVWWIGKGDGFDVVAYGNRRNMRGQGGIPEPVKGDRGQSTWWPSSNVVNWGLVRMLGETGAGAPFKAGLFECESLAEFNRYFNHRYANTVRGYPYRSNSLMEFMLRVDHVCYDVDVPLVFGSPVWVAATFTPIPGTYDIGDFFLGKDRQVHRSEPGSEVGDPESVTKGALAIWDGSDWVKDGAYWKGGHRLDPKLGSPPVPLFEPRVGDFVDFEQKVPDNRPKNIP